MTTALGSARLVALLCLVNLANAGAASAREPDKPSGWGLVINVTAGELSVILNEGTPREKVVSIESLSVISLRAYSAYTLRVDGTTTTYAVEVPIPNPGDSSGGPESDPDPGQRAVFHISSERGKPELFRGVPQSWIEAAVHQYKDEISAYGIASPYLASVSPGVARSMWYQAGLKIRESALSSGLNRFLSACLVSCRLSAYESPESLAIDPKTATKPHGLIASVSEDATWPRVEVVIYGSGSSDGRARQGRALDLRSDVGKFVTAVVRGCTMVELMRQGGSTSLFQESAVRSSSVAMDVRARYVDESGNLRASLLRPRMEHALQDVGLDIGEEEVRTPDGSVRSASTFTYGDVRNPPAYEGMHYRWRTKLVVSQATEGTEPVMQVKCDVILEVKFRSQNVTKFKPLVDIDGFEVHISRGYASSNDLGTAGDPTVKKMQEDLLVKILARLSEP